MKRYWHAMVKIVAIVCLVALLLTACAPGAAPPAEKGKTVKVQVAGALTGPLASTTWGLTWGVVDYLKYVNDQGGIEYQTPEGKTDRVKLVFAWEDHAYNAARAVSVYKRQIRDDVLAYYTTAASMVETTLGMITKDRMPVVGNEMQSPLVCKTEPIFYISESPGYVSIEAAFANWVKQNWKLERPPKMGLMCVDTVTSRGQHPGGLPDYCAGIGVDFVGLEWEPFGLTDSTIELTRLAAKGADWIYINHILAGVNVVVKDATRMGLREKIKFCAIPYGFDVSLIKLAPEAAEGVYGQTVVGLYPMRICLG